LLDGRHDHLRSADDCHHLVLLTASTERELAHSNSGKLADSCGYAAAPLHDGIAPSHVRNEASPSQSVLRTFTLITAWRASSIDERAEHGLEHGFDGRIIDALGLRQLGRDGFEVAIACRWRQRHRAALRTIASWLWDKRKMRLASARFIAAKFQYEHKYAHPDRADKARQ